MIRALFFFFFYKINISLSNIPPSLISPRAFLQVFKIPEENVYKCILIIFYHKYNAMTIAALRTFKYRILCDRRSHKINKFCFRINLSNTPKAEIPRDVDEDFR